MDCSKEQTSAEVENRLHKRNNNNDYDIIDFSANAIVRKMIFQNSPICQNKTISFMSAKEKIFRIMLKANTFDSKTENVFHESH